MKTKNLERKIVPADDYPSGKTNATSLAPGDSASESHGRCLHRPGDGRSGSISRRSAAALAQGHHRSRWLHGQVTRRRLRRRVAREVPLRNRRSRFGELGGSDRVDGQQFGLRIGSQRHRDGTSNSERSVAALRRGHRDRRAARRGPTSLRRERITTSSHLRTGLVGAFGQERSGCHLREAHDQSMGVKLGDRTGSAAPLGAVDTDEIVIGRLATRKRSMQAVIAAFVKTSNRL
jgi:hypothetical protein